MPGFVMPGLAMPCRTYRFPSRAGAALFLVCGFAASAQAQPHLGPSDTLLRPPPADTAMPEAHSVTAMNKTTRPPGGHGHAGHKADSRSDKTEPPPEPTPSGRLDPLSPTPKLGETEVPGGRNITATGKTMPPTNGRGTPALLKASTQADMLKAQKQAEERNKAWDAKMKKTMGSICSGC